MEEEYTSRFTGVHSFQLLSEVMLSLAGVGIQLFPAILLSSEQDMYGSKLNHHKPWGLVHVSVCIYIYIIHVLYIYIIIYIYIYNHIYIYIYIYIRVNRGGYLFLTHTHNGCESHKLGTDNELTPWLSQELLCRSGRS